MNKYVWAECPSDSWPVIKTCVASSYNDAIEKLIIRYGEELDDDAILDTIDNWENHIIALSDLEDYDEI